METGHQTTVATFSDLDKAQGVKQRLTEAGIQADVLDESKLQKFWFLSKPLAADKVMVDEKDFEKARQVLQAADAQDHILSGEIRCPQCKSARIDYPQFTRKFMSTTLVEVFCLLHLVDKKFYCQDCHYMWPVSVELRPTNDAMQWPEKNPELVKKEKGG
jgi:transposase-like protein